MSELVTDYMERALPLHTRLGAWLHLRQCDMCRRYFRQMRATVQLLSSAPTVEVESPAVESVLNAIPTRRDDA